jgi:membrane protease YdiL (CAAX protease family)
VAAAVPVAVPLVASPLVRAAVPAALALPAAATRGAVALAATPSPAASRPVETASFVRSFAAPSDARAAAALRTIEVGAASWESRRTEALESSLVAAADGPAAPRPSLAPAPGRARPGLAKAALAVGGSLLGVAAAAAVAHSFLPAALVGLKGALAFAGFGFLALSRFWRAPSAPPAPAPVSDALSSGTFATFRAMWASASGAADAQTRLEARVGGSSWASLRDWAMGGLRAALFWLPVTLVTMLVGAVAGKGLGAALGFHAAAAAAPLSLMKMSLGALALGPLATNLIELSMSLFAFDAARALMTKLGAGRAAAPLAGVAAVALAGAMLIGLTHSPFVILASLAVDASFLWLRAKSGSWLAPLALGGLFSMLSLDSARVGVWLKYGAGGVLQSLPAVWTGAAVALLLVGGLAWSARSLVPSTLWRTLKEHLAAVTEFGAAWRAPAGDAPRSPWRLLRMAGLWGLVTYAVGDLTYWGVNAIAAGSEPAPAVLARMLTSPVDLVLYNFLFVGFFEEFVFRRGIFRSLRDWLVKRGLTLERAFWTSAVASALIFSGAHYIDYGVVLGKLGLGQAFASSGLGGSYAFSWAGFGSRTVLGVLMAWMYQRSGVLALPALAHAAADTMEGLGLRWGLAPFLAMAAADMFAQKIGAKVRAAVLPSTPVYRAMIAGLVYAGIAAALAPVVWGAAPAMMGFFLVGSMSVLVLAVTAGANLVRWLRRAAPPKPATWRRRLAAAALGVTLGLGAGVAPQVATGPIAQTMYAFSDAVNHKHTDVRWVSGGVMQDETARVLGANPVGRSILERLHDRGGALRLPTFFLRSSGDDPGLEIVADHEGFTDGLYIGAGALKAHGWSAEEFLKRPDWQRQLVVENQVTLAHELTHAVQSRRSPFARETWMLNRIEAEYEAYATEILYTHEWLKADPAAKVDPDSYYEYLNALDHGLLETLKDHDSDYPQDHHIDGPRWRAFRDQTAARWPALRVEGYMTMAARFVDHPRIAADYIRKARAAASAAGLPDPSPSQVVSNSGTTQRP